MGLNPYINLWDSTARTRPVCSFHRAYYIYIAVKNPAGYFISTVQTSKQTQSLPTSSRPESAARWLRVRGIVGFSMLSLAGRAKPAHRVKQPYAGPTRPSCPPIPRLGLGYLGACPLSISGPKRNPSTAKKRSACPLSMFPSKANHIYQLQVYMNGGSTSESILFQRFVLIGVLLGPLQGLFLPMSLDQRLVSSSKKVVVGDVRT